MARNVKPKSSNSKIAQLNLKNYVLRLTTYPTPYISLFLFLFAIYLFTYTPRINSSDGQAMFATAESLVRQGDLAIEQIRWMGLQQGSYGLDGLLYSRKGIGVPIALLPLTWLGLVTPWFGTVGVSLLFNAIVTAATAVLILAYLQQLGYHRQVALMVALTFGLATLAWPYAKSLFSDPFAGLLLLAAAYSLLRFYQDNLQQDGIGQSGHNLPDSQQSHLPTWSASRRLGLQISYVSLRYLFLAGLFLGWNVATRYAEALFVPLFTLLLIYYLLKICYEPQVRLREHMPDGAVAKARLLAGSFWPPILVFMIPLVLIGLSLIIFNVTRYGDPFNTGYLPNETFSGALWEGVLGQLLSPGRGLWLYSPILLLSLWGIRSFYWRHRPEALLALSIIIIHLLLYGKWFMWHGGYAWGPRFMIPTLPFWAIFLAPVIEHAFPGGGFAGKAPAHSRSELIQSSLDRVYLSGERQTVLFRISFIILTILSIIPQFLTLIIDFAPFQNSLLDTGLPLFDRQTFFNLEYSSLLKAWSFVGFNTLDLVWFWQGQFNWWLLGILAANIIIAGFCLKKSLGNSKTTTQNAIRNFSGRPLASLALLLTCISTLVALISLLTYSHTLPSKSLQEAVTIINNAAGPKDAVITNNPETAISFAELYKGRAPVLGLSQSGFPLPDEVADRIRQLITHHAQVWWLPNWLPSQESAIEQTLLAAGFRARDETFNGQRLVLFAYPAGQMDERPLTETNFDALFHLEKVSYISHVPAGTALPVALSWRAAASIPDDYHVFIHLLDEQGQMVAQADGQPGLWSRPTSGWQVDETILDRHALWIAPDIPAGHYQLTIGVYHPIGGQRLQLPDGSDVVRLEVEIGPNDDSMPGS